MHIHIVKSTRTLGTVNMQSHWTWSTLHLLRGTHSIKDAFTNLTGASKPHHVLNDKGLVLGYCHFGMLAAARWIHREVCACVDPGGCAGLTVMVLHFATCLLAHTKQYTSRHQHVHPRDWCRSNSHPPTHTYPCCIQPPHQTPCRCVALDGTPLPQATPLLERHLAEHPGFSLRVMGHSLGGGTAAMLSMMYGGVMPTRQTDRQIDR